jgi:hypothetical protein
MSPTECLLFQSFASGKVRAAFCCKVKVFLLVCFQDSKCSLGLNEESFIKVRCSKLKIFGLIDVGLFIKENKKKLRRSDLTAFRMHLAAVKIKFQYIGNRSSCIEIKFHFIQDS